MEYKDIIYKTPVKHGLINYENTYKDFNWKISTDALITSLIMK
jgi:hypothetical protein